MERAARRHRVRRARPGLVGGLAAALLVVLLGLVGPAPAGAQEMEPDPDPDPCTVSEATDFVCRAYLSFTGRPATTAELATWAPQVPARRTSFVAGLARSVEGLDRTVAAYYARFGGRAPSAGDLGYWRDQALAPNGLRRLEAALLANRRASDEELVLLAYGLYLGRAPSPTDQAYWVGRVEDGGRNRFAADMAYSAEARRTRVRAAYRNELDVTVDGASRDHWAERLRTGTSHLDLRIALRSSPAGYRSSTAECSPAAPQTGPVCLPPPAPEVDGVRADAEAAST